jgi:hypothetical protein
MERVATFRDAYFLLSRVTNPLKEISSEVMVRAFRKVYITNDDEKSLKKWDVYKAPTLPFRPLVEKLVIAMFYL